jgi:type I restriction enzyme R subunit
MQVPDRFRPSLRLCAGSYQALRTRDDIGFFQVVKAALGKPCGPRETTEELDHAVGQLVAKPMAPEGEIIDVFQAAGLKQPDISILLSSPQCAD